MERQAGDGSVSEAGGRGSVVKFYFLSYSDCNVRNV